MDNAKNNKKFYETSTPRQANPPRRPDEKPSPIVT